MKFDFMKNNLLHKAKNAFGLLANTYKHWMKHEPFQMSAAVSYYALFSFPALLIIVIRTAGVFYEKSLVKDKITREISTMLGKDAGTTIDTMLKSTVSDGDSQLFLILGVLTLLYGASGLFISLQKSLNTIWEVTVKPKNEYLKMIKDRLFSLGIVVIIGFLLLISLVITTIINVLTGWITDSFPNIVLYLVKIINFVVSTGITTVLFAMIFKILPDVKLRWKYVWLGAFVTTLLFAIGKAGLSIYFGETNPASAFGAAGSVILLLLWVSYSCLILFFGAAFTHQYAKINKVNIETNIYAEILK